MIALLFDIVNDASGVVTKPDSVGRETESAQRTFTDLYASEMGFRIFRRAKPSPSKTCADLPRGSP